MAQSEPILTDDDRAVWGAWMRAAAEHARTQAFARKVERARVAVIEACEWVARHPCPVAPRPRCERVEWQRLDGDAPPDRRARGVQTRRRRHATGRPRLPRRARVRRGARHAPRHRAAPHRADDQRASGSRRPRAAARSCPSTTRARAPGLSEQTFYPLMERDNLTRGLAFIGLRREESRNRDRVVAVRSAGVAAPRGRRGTDRIAGSRWHKAAGTGAATPSRSSAGSTCTPTPRFYDVPLLPVYQCVGLMHRDDPSRIRVAWWLPAGHTADGQVAAAALLPLAVSSAARVDARRADVRVALSDPRPRATMERRRWTGRPAHDRR